MTIPSLRKYAVVGSQPIIVAGRSYGKGEEITMFADDAQFFLQIGAVEEAVKAVSSEGAVPFNTMADPPVIEEDTE